MDPKPANAGGVETPPNPKDVIAKVFNEKLNELRSAAAASSVDITDTAPPLVAQATTEELDIDAQLAGQRLTMYGFNEADARKASEPFALNDPDPLVQTQVAGSPVQPSVSPEPAPPLAPVGKPEQSAPKKKEEPRFKLPRMGKVATLKFRASDGSIYEIMKKPGGYRISKEGDPKIASISKTSIEQRGQAEGWVVMEEDPGPASVVSGGSAAEKVSEILDALSRQKDIWMAKIQAASTLNELARIGSEADGNGSHTLDTGPCFVVGKPLVKLIREHSLQKGTHDAEIVTIKEKAYLMQREIADVYLAKRIALAKRYNGASKASVATVVPQAEPITQSPVVQKAEPLPQAPAAKVEDSPIPEPVVQLDRLDMAAILMLLDAGQKAAFRRADGSGGHVEKQGDLYWVFEENGGFITLGAAGLKEKAEREDWKSVEAPALPSTQGEAKPELTELEAKIATLREAVTVARTAFVAAEESQASSWKKLMQTFRTLAHQEADDRDLHILHSEYDRAVLALQEAELEKLKRSGKTLGELRPQMAALIREVQFDEAERIYDERRSIRLARTNQPLSEKLEARWQETIGSLEAEVGKGAKWKEYIRYILGATGDMGGAAMQGVEKLGKANNEFTKKYGKYILTATVTVGGAVALGAATGGVASVAIGALTLKRLAAGAGLAVAAEAGMDKYAASRREKRSGNVEVDQAEFFQKIEDDVETKEVEAIARGEEMEGKLDLSSLEAFLKAEAAKARRGEGARRRNALLRKSGAIFAGVVLGSGAASHLVHDLFADKADVAAGAVSPGATVPSAESASGTMPAGPTGGEVSVVDNPVGPPSVAVPETTAASPASPVRPVVSTEVHVDTVGAKAKDFLSTYDVKRGDNIWKLAERAVGDVPDMNDRASERFAKLVELKLQEKLESSPQLARAAGFVANADGKFSVHSIQAGAKLDIGKLISADEMSKLIVEAKSTAPIEAAVPDTSASHIATGGKGSVSMPEAVGKTAGGRDIYPGLVKAFEDSSAAGQPNSVSVPAANAVDGVVELRPEAALLHPNGNVMTYIQSLPEGEQKQLFQNFKRVSDEIFQTDEVMNSEGYHRSFNPISQTELVKTKLATALSDHDALARNPLSSYDRQRNPLHWSQMEMVAKLAKASGKTFGVELARARVGESIQEYVLRMVALAGNEGKKIPGFRMLN